MGALGGGRGGRAADDVYALPHCLPCSPSALPQPQGAVGQFTTFVAGLVVTVVALKSMDRLLYSLDET